MALARIALGCFVGVNNSWWRQSSSSRWRSSILPITARPFQMGLDDIGDDVLDFIFIKRLLAARFVHTQHDVVEDDEIGDAVVQELAAATGQRAVALAVVAVVSQHPVPVFEPAALGGATVGTIGTDKVASPLGRGGNLASTIIGPRIGTAVGVHS